MQLNPKEVYDCIVAAIQTGIVPMIHGSPGIGKSQIVHAIAKEYNLKVIDLRLSQCDPTDLSGFPQIDNNRKKGCYLPMDTFPLENDPIPEEYSGWLLFFDEINSAPKTVQAAAYKIILDRLIGQHSLHKKCLIVAAGNLETDNAIVESLSTALQSRMLHLELVPDLESWIDWANSNNIDNRIISYLRFQPELLFSFKPNHIDKTYACPRTWEFANRLLQRPNLDSTVLLALLSGTLSEGVAREFFSFIEIYTQLPKLEDILKSPKTVKISKESSILYALSGLLIKSVDKNNLDDAMKFISRLPAEFQVITIKGIIKKDKNLISTPIITEWITQTGHNLF